MNTNIPANVTNSNLLARSSLTTSSIVDVITNEIFEYLELNKSKIPSLFIFYILTIIWVVYLILYHSRVQGIILSHILRRLYFKDAIQFKVDSFSISFISGSIMFRNLHYSTGSYCIFVKDGYLIFRYWSKSVKRPAKRLKIQLNYLDIQYFIPIRSNSNVDINNQYDDSSSGSTNGISSKNDDSQWTSPVQISETKSFINSLRSLFPAIEIKVEHGRLSAGYCTLPYSLVIRFSTISSTFTSQSPSRNLPDIDLMTLIYKLTYRNLRIQFHPIKAYNGEHRDSPPPVTTTKSLDQSIFQVFECCEGEIEYEQDVPGQNEGTAIEITENGDTIPDVKWEIRVQCKKETHIAYCPWADRQRELLWQYFLPTLHEESPITIDPIIGQTRIFKSVRFQLFFGGPTTFDLYFMNKTKLQQLQVKCLTGGSSLDAILPFSTNPDGFHTHLSLNICKPVASTNLSYSRLFQAENLSIKIHVHYPRIWNCLQNWFIHITAKQPQVYFVFEHKNFFQAFINDMSSSSLPNIYSFTPYIYHIDIVANDIEVLIPSNQGNWIDCSNDNPENNFLSLCAKSLLLNLPIPFLEFCPDTTLMDLTVQVENVLGRLVIPESNRLFYIIEGLDKHKRFYSPDGIKSRLSLSDEFEKRHGCFECGEIGHIKVLINISFHPSPPIDVNRPDLLYVQQVKSFGTRQTFHPNKLEYDAFNIEIDIGPVNLFVYGLVLKNLWWVKENLFGWDLMYHDINEINLINEQKLIVNDDPLLDIIDETKPFDPRYYRPFKIDLRVAIHAVTGHLIHHTDDEPCPIGFCERICVELTTNLEETKVQVVLLPANVYIEDKIVRNKSDQHLSTGCFQLSGLIIRGQAMLSHEGLPPERETLEYAWQMEILLGKISARLTMIQLEKAICYLKNFYLQMMQDEYSLIRSPVMDKTKWIERLKYDVLRFSLDSVDVSLIESGNAINAQAAPVRLCMCNLHTSQCNESLTLKVGTIQIRQLIRLYTDSWLEAGSICIPELRVNGKFDCHAPTPTHINEQFEFLRRHDQHSQRLHFLYNTKSQQAFVSQSSLAKSTVTSASTIGMPPSFFNQTRSSNLNYATNMNNLSCACLGGSPNYYTLVQGEQFFKSSFRLSEQPSFGRSLFRPDVHVIHSHPIFEHKYNWNIYEYPFVSNEQLPEEEIYYPFDFCAQKNTNEPTIYGFNEGLLPSQYSLIRSNSVQSVKRKSIVAENIHKRSSLSVALDNNITQSLLLSASNSDVFLTPNEHLSAQCSARSSLANAHTTINTTLMETKQGISLPSSSSMLSTPSISQSQLKNFNENDDALSITSSIDSLKVFEDILRNHQTTDSKNQTARQSVSSVEHFPTSPLSSWISLRSQMKTSIPKSTLLCTTYIRYLSHYRSSTWSNISSFPPSIQQEHMNHRPLLDFDRVSQGFSCTFLSESPPLPTASRHQSFNLPARIRTPMTPSATSISFNSSNIIATEREISLRFVGAFNIILTPLMLECLTTYIKALEAYDRHPMGILDGLHFQTHTTSNCPSPAVDLSATKISFQLSKINICLLQAGLAEDNVQFSELRTPLDIVTMSLFALSCKKIRMETILSNHDKSTAAVFKIESLTGQFRRFENDFSSIDDVQIHAMQSQRCHLQFHISNDIQTHLPFGKDRKKIGFVMNEFGLQRVCFKLINNRARQKEEQKSNTPIVNEINETVQPGKGATKHKSKGKNSSEPSSASNPVSTTSPNIPVVTTLSTDVTQSNSTSLSSLFDGSIDKVWVSFPEPPRHTHSMSNLSRRTRQNTTTNSPAILKQINRFSYTRYDWNFLSTLSPTVLGWFCVLHRIKTPVQKYIEKREKHLDAVLAYFLIEAKPLSTLPKSKLHELFTPKTRHLVSHPVCELITELRKGFNQNMQIHSALKPDFLPDIDLLKQGIRGACRDWANKFRRETDLCEYTVPVSSKLAKPARNTSSENKNNQEKGQNIAGTQRSVLSNHFQRLIGHEFVIAHSRTPHTPTIRDQKEKDQDSKLNSNVRKRLKEQSSHSNTNKGATIIDMTKEPSTKRGVRFFEPPSGHINVAFDQDDTLRRFESSATVNNKSGYEPLDTQINDLNVDDNQSDNSNQNDSASETTYYTDAGPELAGTVEQIFKILFEYAGVKLSVGSSIEPLFNKLGHNVLVTVQIKDLNAKILHNEKKTDPHSLIAPPSVELSVLSITNLNIQSACRQSLEHGQLHVANVQAGIRVKRVKQEVNLSLLRLVYQFYSVVGNAVEYTDIDDISKRDSNSSKRSRDYMPDYFNSNTIQDDNDNLIDLERKCWKKLRELVSIYDTQPEVKQVVTRKRQKSNYDNQEQQPRNIRLKSIQTRFGIANPINEKLLLSGFGWLIIDEIYFSASLGGLQVEGRMSNVQGSINLSQKLRTLQAIANNQTPKKYDGSLIVQIGSTTLSLKETLSTLSDSFSTKNQNPKRPSTLNQIPPTKQISVLDITIGKSHALTSLQTRGFNLTLSGVANIGNIAMNVPLRPQEVHDLVSRTGRFISTCFQEFRSDGSQLSSATIAKATTVQATRSLPDSNENPTDEIESKNTSLLSERNSKAKRSHFPNKHTLPSNTNQNLLNTDQNPSLKREGPVFEVHIIAHCQGMTFSTALLSTLTAQYKIGIVEGVARLTSKTSRFTAVMHEHALYFLNNNIDNSNNTFPLPRVNCDDHVRIGFPEIRCYGNYTIKKQGLSEPKGHLNLRTNIDSVKLTITANFLAQIVFVSKVIIYEINEILAKVYGVEQFYFRSITNDQNQDLTNQNEDDTDNGYIDNKISTALFTYKIDIIAKGFDIIGQTPSNTIVKFENPDKNVPIFVKLTNYNEINNLLLYTKPIINASFSAKLSLGQLLRTGDFQDATYFQTGLLLRNSFDSEDLEKQAFFICLKKPSFYWQPGAIDKGILFWLNYKNTYDHWNEQRGAFKTPAMDSASIRSFVNVQNRSTTIRNELRLMFQLNIVDLGIAIPLQPVDQSTKMSSTTVDSQSINGSSIEQPQATFDDSSDFLVFTLDKTAISACSCGAIISEGSFEGFCLRFAENFRQTDSDWKPIRPISNSATDVILNACCVPSGRYSMHLRSKHGENSAKHPEWLLNIQWDMKGIDINIDSIIGKRFSQLIQTITATHLIQSNDHSTNDSDSVSNSDPFNTQYGSAKNLYEINDPNEEDEKRKRLEYEYSNLWQRIRTSQQSQVENETLKSDQERLLWLEKVLVHTFKSDIHQRMKKQSIKPSHQQQQYEFIDETVLSTSPFSRDRGRAYLSTLSVPHHNLSETSDYSNLTRNTGTGIVLSDVLASSIAEDDVKTEVDESANKDTRNVSHESQASSSATTTTNMPNEITSPPTVQIHLNLHIQIASGSFNLYTRCDLLNSSVNTNLTKPQQQPDGTNIVTQTVNQIKYQISEFSLPGVEVDVNYNSKKMILKNRSSNKRATLYCRAILKSPKTKMVIHPILLDFLEQTLEHVKLPREQRGQTNASNAQIENTNENTDHVKTMFLIEDQELVNSFPIDIVVNICIQPCILLFTCLPTSRIECELHLPAVDVVFSSKRSLSNNDKLTTDNDLPKIILDSAFGLSFSLYMKDFKLNVYHQFSGKSRVQVFEDFGSEQIQKRNALSVIVQSVSINISRTRCILVDHNNEPVNNIELSIIAQMSKGLFECDIRRYSEILKFPKIWYNRSLARRLFLGDESVSKRSASTTTVMKNPIIFTQSTNSLVRKQARVLLALQLKELHVSMRMSTIMGKVEWNTKDVSSIGSLNLTSEGKRSYNLSVGLQDSIFQAEDGIIVGNVKLKNLRTGVSINQEIHDNSQLVDASHVISLLIHGIQVRLDYMGSPTLMGRMCHVVIRLKDDRHSTTTNPRTVDATGPATLVLLNIEWSQLHLMIRRSTTPDIIEMIIKLKDFFNSQIAQSKNMLESIQYNFRRERKQNKEIEHTSTNNSMTKSATSEPKRDKNMIKRFIGMNGGEILLQGHNLTLVVFHGISFKSKHWALFSLNEPRINFVTDRGIEGDINQKLFFHLDHQNQTTPGILKSRANMASISRIIRNSGEAPAHLIINDWFNYANATVSAAGLRDFPDMDEPQTPTFLNKTREKQYDLRVESIFILPALELCFQTKQLQGEVCCSFDTEFYEHIMFSFNAEHFYFLHDLIISYIKEKDRVIAAGNDKRVPRPTGSMVNSNVNQTTVQPLTEIEKDNRSFICPDTKWKLKPTIKLLTAYGNEVEPIGADYILEKLGFHHARLTIPKWFQRGVMDPCEQSMDIVQHILIFLLPERYKDICMKS